MTIKQYPKHNGTEEERGFTVKEIKAGHHTLFCDHICNDCGYVQPMAAGYECRKCGRKY